MKYVFRRDALRQIVRSYLCYGKRSSKFVKKPWRKIGPLAGSQPKAALISFRNLERVKRKHGRLGGILRHIWFPKSIVNKRSGRCRLLCRSGL